jgi:hypothetical protein
VVVLLEALCSIQSPSIVSLLSCFEKVKRAYDVTFLFSCLLSSVAGQRLSIDVPAASVKHTQP